MPIDSADVASISASEIRGAHEEAIFEEGHSPGPLSLEQSIIPSAGNGESRSGRRTLVGGNGFYQLKSVVSLGRGGDRTDRIGAIVPRGRSGDRDGHPHFEPISRPVRIPGAVQPLDLVAGSEELEILGSGISKDGL
jgi:hypothetical protein